MNSCSGMTEDAAVGSSIERVNSISGKDRVRVKRKTLEAVLEQCQRALELLSNSADGVAADDDDDDDDDSTSITGSDAQPSSHRSPSQDREADELCSLLKSRVECPDFLEKLESAQVSFPQNITEEGSSWDMVSENDLWEGGNKEVEDEDYVLVRQEDIVDGIACFMAAYLLSIKQTKDLTPNQLQDALSKTFSLKKKKGKLRKAWDGSKVIYNVASWGATAIGIEKPLEISIDKELKKGEKKDVIAAQAAENVRKEPLKDDHDAFTVVIGGRASVLDGQEDADTNVKDVTVSLSEECCDDISWEEDIPKPSHP